jgi:hypothetical protein
VEKSGRLRSVELLVELDELAVIHFYIRNGNLAALRELECLLESQQLVESSRLLHIVHEESGVGDSGEVNGLRARNPRSRAAEAPD